MWTRALLKQNAKNSLQGRYGRCILVCLVAGFLTGTGGGSASQTASQTVRDMPYNPYWEQLLPLLLIAILIALALGLAFAIFVSGPVSVGRCRYFMENRSGLTPWSTLWSVFRGPYLNVVKVQFLVGLKIALGMLLIIPGIYWSLCYCQVPYLLAENPYLSTGRAMELSRQMMEGEKLATFVLELSFLGWYLLCLLTLGIGFIFLAPYERATFAELYAALRAKALALHLSDTQELGGFVQRG